ncbi:MAG: hypothetical protein FJ098_10860, partial [Deltaproteobacteria bacterium]|nr:hypothetical protein [Deltaproteobacteria bacterium]
FPAEVTDWTVDPARDLGIDGRRYVVYDWVAGTAAELAGPFTLPPMPHLYDYAFLVLAPVQENGLALLGEVAKYVPLADRRFREVTVTPTGFDLVLEGVPGEEVSVLAWDADAGAPVGPVAVNLDAEGLAVVSIGRP